MVVSIFLIHFWYLVLKTSKTTRFVLVYIFETNIVFVVVFVSELNKYFSVHFISVAQTQNGKLSNGRQYTQSSNDIVQGQSCQIDRWIKKGPTFRYEGCGAVTRWW